MSILFFYITLDREGNGKSNILVWNGERLARSMRTPPPDSFGECSTQTLREYCQLPELLCPLLASFHSIGKSSLTCNFVKVGMLSSNCLLRNLSGKSIQSKLKEKADF